MRKARKQYIYALKLFEVLVTPISEYGIELWGFKRELQCQDKLISSETLSKILQNETKIIKIDQAVLEIFNFKD